MNGKKYDKRPKAGLGKVKARQETRKARRIVVPRDKWDRYIMRNPRPGETDVIATLSVEDIRDETVGIIKASFGDDLGKLRQRHGPVPATVRNWDQGLTANPRMSTLRAALVACDHDLVIRPTAS